MINHKDILFSSKPMAVNLFISAALVSAVIVGKTRANDLLMLVSFFLGFWPGVIVSDVRLTRIHAMVNAFLVSFAILVMSSILLYAIGILFSHSYDSLFGELLSVWLVGGFAFTLWIMIGLLIRLRRR